MAAQTWVSSLATLSQPLENVSYEQHMQNSWVYRDLYAVRNIRPGFRYGLWRGLTLATFETYVTHGNTPWTLSHRSDASALKPASQMQKIHYPLPDGKLTFDRASSVYLSQVHHVEQQPCHLLINDRAAIEQNYHVYASAETRYCPAGVYEIAMVNQQPQLQINAQNCLHCKTCDIKDPQESILWTTPEGGGGPNYVWM